MAVENGPKEELWGLLDRFPQGAEPLLAAIDEDRVDGRFPRTCAYGHVAGAAANGLVLEARRGLTDWDLTPLERFVRPIGTPHGRRAAATLREWVAEWMTAK